ncbi:MAG: hypothetical protein KC503_11355 [Myxococcales bacterium]|nr:hypothetical protein [Myxococcales bacterium]
MTRLSPTARRLLLLVFAVFWVLGLATGCKRDSDLRDDEKLKVVVNKDRKLAKREVDLLSRRGALQRERQKVREKRNALVTKKASLLDDDDEGKKQLQSEESKLVQLERKLAKQEVDLNSSLQQLLSEKNKLGGGLSGTQAKLLMVQRREHSIALREKDLSRREGSVAQREKVLADRERLFAARQARLCPGRVTTVVQMPSAPGKPGKNYGRGDVEPVFRAAMQAMRSKGILAADLPPGVDRLIAVIRRSVSKKKYSRAKFAADQLLSAVRRIRINRSFIGAKIGRLSRAMKRKRLRGGKKRRANSLFQGATASYGDGRFSDANRKLNSIYALLH